MSMMVSFFHSETNSQENLETPRQREPRQQGQAATRIASNNQLRPLWPQGIGQVSGGRTEDPNQSQTAARSTGAEQVSITCTLDLLIETKIVDFFNVYEIVFRLVLFMLWLWWYFFHSWGKLARKSGNGKTERPSATRPVKFFRGDEEYRAEFWWVDKSSTAR